MVGEQGAGEGGDEGGGGAEAGLVGVLEADVEVCEVVGGGAGGGGGVGLRVVVVVSEDGDGGGLDGRGENGGDVRQGIA